MSREIDELIKFETKFSSRFYDGLTSNSFKFLVPILEFMNTQTTRTNLSA